MTTRPRADVTIGGASMLELQREVTYRLEEYKWADKHKDYPSVAGKILKATTEMMIAQSKLMEDYLLSYLDFFFHVKDAEKSSVEYDGPTLT